MEELTAQPTAQALTFVEVADAIVQLAKLQTTRYRKNHI